MAQTLLGVVDRYALARSGPGARLRPLFQASHDRTRWIPPEDEFPNSGVVSWWQPLPDAEIYRAWIFNIEPSRTYDAANEHHDFFGVTGSPTLAVELIDLTAAADPEQMRAILFEEGIPLERCASKRLVFRDRSGSMVGPLDLSLREDRLFMEERDALVSLNQSIGDLVLGEWEGHAFFPLKYRLRKTGEVDFSPNGVFLKRVLRDIGDMPQAMVGNAKLTERLITSYCSALEKMSLSPLQSQRLKRLHKLTEQASAAFTLVEEAIPDVLALPAVKKIISAAGEKAAQGAIEERRADLEKIDQQRIDLEAEVGTLRSEAARLRGEIASSQSEQANLLSSFDTRIQEKFVEIGKNATSFLSEVAVIRAAISSPGLAVASVTQTMSLPERPAPEPLDADRLVSAFRDRFDVNGLGCILPTALLSSWAAGFVPMLFGVLAREALLLAGDALFGGCIHFATVSPTLSSPGQLLDLPTMSLSSVSPVREIISDSSRSPELVLLVFENTNLCQLDSTLLPLLRSYTSFHAEPRKLNSPVVYPTPAGLWPSNLLLSGILIDSPLALPLSGELWACTTFIHATAGRVCAKSGTAGSRDLDVRRHLSYEQWLRWLDLVDQGDPSDTRVFATHAIRELESSALFKRMVRRLAAAIDQTASGMSEPKRAGFLAEMSIVPYLLSRGGQPHILLHDPPVELSADDGFVDMVTRLFEKWGLETGRDSHSRS